MVHFAPVRVGHAVECRKLVRLLEHGRMHGLLWQVQRRGIGGTWHDVHVNGAAHVLQQVVQLQHGRGIEGGSIVAVFFL